MLTAALTVIVHDISTAWRVYADEPAKMLFIKRHEISAYLAVSVGVMS